MTEETTKLKVWENKFSGTATLEVEGTDNKKKAKAVARKFFSEEYGHSPSKIVAEKKEHSISDDLWKVMVADHSSGSLKTTETYEVKE